MRFLVPLLFISTLGTVSAFAQEAADIDHVVTSLKEKGGQMDVPSGAEGSVREIIDLKNGSYLVYFRIIRWPEQKSSGAGLEVWTLDSVENGALDYYVLDRAISYQTRNFMEADFVKVRKKTGVLLHSEALSALLGEDNTSGNPCLDDRLKLSRFFPISKRHTKKNRKNKKAFEGKGEPACVPLPKKCRLTNPRSLKKAHKLKSYILEAQNETGVDGALIASLLMQESHFNPLIENQFEKRSCMRPTKENPCSEYRWSKGMAQIGRIMAEKYGLDWDTEIPKINACTQASKRGNQPGDDDCINAVEKFCTDRFNESGKYPVFCPKQAIATMAKELKEMLSRERTVRVLVQTKDGRLEEVYLDIQQIVNSNRSSQFRYLSAEYNRGPRVDNSIEEYFRQYGNLPPDFGSVWSTERKEETPSKEMGFRILNNEYINRCYVWNIAGLCGESLPIKSLGRFYSKELKEK